MNLPWNLYTGAYSAFIRADLKYNLNKWYFRAQGSPTLWRPPVVYCVAHIFLFTIQRNLISDEKKKTGSTGFQYVQKTTIIKQVNESIIIAEQ